VYGFRFLDWEGEESACYGGHLWADGRVDGVGWSESCGGWLGVREGGREREREREGDREGGTEKSGSIHWASGQSMSL